MSNNNGVVVLGRKKAVFVVSPRVDLKLCAKHKDSLLDYISAHLDLDENEANQDSCDVISCKELANHMCQFVPFNILFTRAIPSGEEE